MAPLYRVLAESIVSDQCEHLPVVKASEDVIRKSTEKFLNGTAKDLQGDVLIRSESDKFDYRLLELVNRVRVLLISDPTYMQLSSDHTDASPVRSRAESTVTSDDESGASDAEMASDDESIENDSNKNGKEKQAAIAVGVRVGSFSDPVDVQGMAHFLEHLLTMGSEKYPKENELDDFLSSRGGYQNAHTQGEYTVYEVKVQRPYLKEALDMLGHAFKSPLLRAESLEKEVKPVDTEFLEAITDDDYRVELLLSHLADKKHPLSNFHSGNIKSLMTEPKAKGIDTRQKVLDFYHRHYGPENIIVVIHAQEPLHNLEQWVVEVFSQIESKSHLVTGPVEHLPTPLSLPFDFPGSRFQRLFLVESVDRGSRFLVQWCLPPVVDKYLVNAYEFLAQLLGHESKGSLLSQLRARDLALDIYSGGPSFDHTNSRMAAMFMLDIQLTDSGATRLDEVAKLLFEYLAVIRKVGAQEYFFRENQLIALKSFNTRSEKSPLNYSIDMVKQLIYFPLEHIFTGNKIYYYFNKEAIDQLLSLMLPEKACFIHLGGKLRVDVPVQVEPWAGIKFQEFPVPPDWLNAASKCTGQSDYFHYPKPNPFIAQNFSIVSSNLPNDAPERATTTLPVQLEDDDRFKVWHKTDFHFKLPIGGIFVQLLSPHLADNLEHVIHRDILFEYLNLVLKEEAYDALLAELDWHLTTSNSGVIIKAQGFNDKLAKLILMLLERFITFDIKDELLESIKLDTIKNYNNQYQDSEFFCDQLIANATLPHHVHFLDRWAQIGCITRDSLLKYRQLVLSTLSFDLFVNGNFTINETKELNNRIKEIFKLDSLQSEPYKRVKHRVYKIPDKVTRVRALSLTEKCPINFVAVYHQLKPYQLRSQLYLDLFLEMANELCFNDLRTNEGLGYRVGCYRETLFGIDGYSIYVASSADKFDCSFIESRIFEFMHKSCREFIFEKLTPEKFQEFVSSEIKRKEAPDVSLVNESKRFFEEILLFNYAFDRIKKEVAQLHKATLEDFRDWTTKEIFVSPETRKLLSIQIVGNGQKSLAECLSPDELPVDDSMIPPENAKCKQLQLLKSIHSSIDCFQLDLSEFRRQMELYPVQPPMRDLID